MLKARKANRVLKIPDEKKKTYIALGYTITDMDGNMIHEHVEPSEKLEQAEKEITPQPVIGKRSYQKYLKENLVRPADEKCAQVKGKVVLTFLVNKEGRPFYIKVKESLCESADKEAIRLIQEGPDWIYGNKLAEVTVKFE